MQKKHSTDADAIIDISSNNDRNQNVIRWEKTYKARKGGTWPQRARVSLKGSRLSLRNCRKGAAGPSARLAAGLSAAGGIAPVGEPPCGFQVCRETDRGRPWERGG